MTCIHFQPAAYNLNVLADAVQPGGRSQTGNLHHTTLATTRLKFLFLAMRIWRHAGRVGVSYSDHYTARPCFERLMNRLRSVSTNENVLAPAIAGALRC
jgi:hypothetical protein